MPASFEFYVDSLASQLAGAERYVNAEAKDAIVNGRGVAAVEILHVRKHDPLPPITDGQLEPNLHIRHFSMRSGIHGPQKNTIVALLPKRRWKIHRNPKLDKIRVAVVQVHLAKDPDAWFLGFRQRRSCHKPRRNHGAGHHCSHPTARGF